MASIREHFARLRGRGRRPGAQAQPATPPQPGTAPPAPANDIAIIDTFGTEAGAPEPPPRRSMEEVLGIGSTLPTREGVTMPPVDWTEPVRPPHDWRWRWRNDAARLARAGRFAARGRAYGDPLGDPGLAQLVAGLGTTLVEVFREDGELTAATTDLRAARWWHQSVQQRVVRAEAGFASDEADPPSLTSDDPAEHARYEEQARARQEHRAAQQELADAGEAVARGERLLQVANERAVRRLTMVAFAGMDRITRYRTALNQAREEMRRPGLDDLGDDFAARLIREAVTPPPLTRDDTEQATPPTADPATPSATGDTHPDGDAVGDAA